MEIKEIVDSLSVRIDSYSSPLIADYNLIVSYSNPSLDILGTLVLDTFWCKSKCASSMIIIEEYMIDIFVDIVFKSYDKYLTDIISNRLPTKYL